MEDIRSFGRWPLKDRRHADYMLERRQGHRIDAYIADLQEKLQRARELKDRLHGRKRDYIFIDP